MRGRQDDEDKCAETRDAPRLLTNGSRGNDLTLEQQRARLRGPSCQGQPPPPHELFPFGGTKNVRCGCSLGATRHLCARWIIETTAARLETPCSRLRRM